MTLSTYGLGAYGRSPAEALVRARRDLTELQRRMMTGMRSDTYGGLGIDRRASLDARGKLASIEGFMSTIGTADLRVKMMVQNLEQLAKLGNETKSDIMLTQFELLGDGRTFTQKNAEARLKEAIDLLNADMAGRRLFSGRAVDKNPVVSYDLIMNGDGTKKGLRQLIEERKAAELGSDGLGRLTLSSAGNTVSLAKEPGSISFGFEVAGIERTGTAMNVSMSGSPAAATVTLSGQPTEGDTVTIALKGPDGATHTITLTASSAAPQSGSRKTFQIGASVTDTVTNLQIALRDALTEKVNAVLGSRSTAVTAEAFFAGTLPDAVEWYQGDDDLTIAARATTPVRTDQTQVVATGARANEAGIRNLLVQFGALAADSFTDSRADELRYAALTEKVFDRLSDKPSNPKVSEIAAELATAANTMKSAKERHLSTKALMLDVLEDVEQVSDEETAVAIMSLQTRLQASYETTSILSRLTLVNYL
jgi:flagellin-like hook-associated protein FlgL